MFIFQPVLVHSYLDLEVGAMGGAGEKTFPYCTALTPLVESTRIPALSPVIK